MLRSAAVYACLLLAACNRPATKPGPSPDAIRATLGPGAKKLEYEKIAAGAADRLRELFNSGDCGRIYEEASREFRALELRDEWLGTCEYLRGKLGSWESFGAERTDAWQSFLEHADRTARFTTGICHVRITWRLENGEARLFRFLLDGAGQFVVIPRGLRMPERRMMDPPPPFRESVPTGD
jgi:hypothetical protein